MSKLEIRYLREEEYEQWDAFVEGIEEGSIFHTSKWNLTLFKGQNVNFSIVACFNSDKLIVGGIAFGWKKVFSLYKVVVTPYASPFSGLLINKRNSEYVSKQENYSFSLVNDLLKFVENDLHILSFSFPPGMLDIRPFNWRDYNSKVFYTYLGDISKPDDILASFLPDIRRRIKIAEKLPFRICDDKGDEHLQTVYALLAKSFERQAHFFRFRENQFIEICKTESLIENIRVFSIWNDNTPVATIIIVIYKNIAYYWMAGGDSAHFDTGLNQLLFWEIIKKLSAGGVKYLDMTGANTTTIAKYKSSYNFKLLPYFYVRKIKGTSTKILFGLKTLLKG